MRLKEFAESTEEKGTANAVLIRTLLNYISKGNWAGLSAFASRVGVPFLSLAGWSGKLNTGEEDELKARRIAQAERDFAP